MKSTFNYANTIELINKAMNEMSKGIYTKNSIADLKMAIDHVRFNYMPEEAVIKAADESALEAALAALEPKGACRQVKLRKLCRRLVQAGIGKDIVLAVAGKKFTCLEQEKVDKLIAEARPLLQENGLLEEEARKENASQKALKATIDANLAALLEKEEDNLVYSEGVLIPEAISTVKGYDLDSKAAILIYKEGRLPNGQRASKEDADWAISHLRNKGLIGKSYWSLDGFGISRKISELGEWAQKEQILCKKILSEEDLAARKELVAKIFADKNSDKILSSICNYNYMTKDGRVVINFEKAEAIRDTIIRGKAKLDLLNKVWFVQAAYEAGYDVGDPYIVLRGAFKMFLDPDLMERREAAREVISSYLNKADQAQAWASFRNSRILWASNELIGLGFDAENEDKLEEALKRSMNSEMSQDDMYWLISELKNHQEFFKNIPDDFGGRNAKASKYDDPTLQYWRGNKAFMEAMDAEYLDRVKVGYDFANWSFCFARALMFSNVMPEDFEEFKYSKRLQSMMKPVLAKYKTLFRSKRILCKATKSDVLAFYENIKNTLAKNWLDLSPDQKMLLKALGESVIPTIRNCTDETSVSTYRWKQINASQAPSLKARGYEVRKTIVTKEEDCNPYEKVVRVPSGKGMVEVKRTVTTKVVTSTKFEVKVVDHIESDLDLMIDGIYTIYHWLQVSPEGWRNCKSISRVLETGLMYGPAHEDYKNDKDNDFGCYLLSLTREDGSERDIAAVDLYGNPLESEEFDNCF